MDTTQVAIIALSSPEHQAAATRAIHAGLARASMDVPESEFVSVDLVHAEFDNDKGAFSFEFDLQLGYSADLIYEEYTVEDFRKSQAIATIITDGVFIAVRENLFAPSTSITP
jgi:hypothetical protein